MSPIIIFSWVMGGIGFFLLFLLYFKMGREEELSRAQSARFALKSSFQFVFYFFLLALACRAINFGPAFDAFINNLHLR